MDSKLNEHIIELKTDLSAVWFKFYNNSKIDLVKTKLRVDSLAILNPYDHRLIRVETTVHVEEEF